MRRSMPLVVLLLTILTEHHLQEEQTVGLKDKLQNIGNKSSEEHQQAKS